MKVEIKSENLTPFAGIYFVNKAFEQCSLSKLIDKELGLRSRYFGYQYSDIFRTIFNIFLSGGDCMEDVQSHLRPTLERIPFGTYSYDKELLQRPVV